MDVTITIRQSDYYALPLDTQQLISLYCGPLYPDNRGVLTMVVSEQRWLEIRESAEANHVR
jgi:hypothetical protein